jgi:hypothetical protein
MKEALQKMYEKLTSGNWQIDNKNNSNNNSNSNNNNKFSKLQSRQ